MALHDDVCLPGGLVVFHDVECSGHMAVAVVAEEIVHPD